MRTPLATGGGRLQPSKVALARVCCSHSCAHCVAGYAQMASLVVSWTRMLDEVQATAEDRPQAEFEHDEAHFLRVCVCVYKMLSLRPFCLMPTSLSLVCSEPVSVCRKQYLQRSHALPIDRTRATSLMLQCIASMWGPAAELPCICKVGHVWLDSLPAVPAVVPGHNVPCMCRSW